MSYIFRGKVEGEECLLLRWFKSEVMMMMFNKPASHNGFVDFGFKLSANVAQQLPILGLDIQK